MCVLAVCAGALLCQCTESGDTSPWDYDASRAKDSEGDTEETDGTSPDAESCDFFWTGADDFKEDADCDSDEFRYVDTMCSLGVRCAS